MLVATVCELPTDKLKHIGHLSPSVSCMMDPVIRLPESDEDLLRECEVQTFRSSGPGGQHVNKTESAVRLRHSPSGLVVTSQQERSQHRNKTICLDKLRTKVK